MLFALCLVISLTAKERPWHIGGEQRADFIFSVCQSHPLPSTHPPTSLLTCRQWLDDPRQDFSQILTSWKVLKRDECCLEIKSQLLIWASLMVAKHTTRKTKGVDLLYFLPQLNVMSFSFDRYSICRNYCQSQLRRNRLSMPRYAALSRLFTSV